MQMLSLLSSAKAQTTFESNINLLLSQKELFCWHFHLCHHDFDSLHCLLHTGQLGSSPLIWAAANCDVPKCASCEYSKVKRCPTGTATESSVPLKQFTLEHDQLYPGQHVSMNHFKVTDKG